MKFRNKGRKIYKTKEKNYYGKSPIGKAFSIGLSVLLIGGIGFIGYSVAEPLVNYSKKTGDDKSSVSVETTADAEITSEMFPTDSNGERIANPHQSVNFETYRAAAVKENDLMSADTLKMAIDRLPTGQKIEYVEVPLKATGGRIYYSSSVPYAYQAQAYETMMSLDEIVSIIKKAGYKPVAIVSTFNDNILPVVDGQSGYITTDTGEQWIDNDYEAGGKPWASPYSQTTLNYLKSIVTEIAISGFDRIICSDFEYPHFRESDLEMLDPELAGPERQMAMTAAANLLNETILENGAKMFIEVSASELLKGYTDVLQPMLLNVNTIVLDIDLDEISNGIYAGTTVYDFGGKASDKVEKMLKLVEEDLADFNVAVRISGSSESMSEVISARDKAVDKGYSSFVIG